MPSGHVISSHWTASFPSLLMFIVFLCGIPKESQIRMERGCDSAPYFVLFSRWGEPLSAESKCKGAMRRARGLSDVVVVGQRLERPPLLRCEKPSRGRFHQSALPAIRSASRSRRYTSRAVQPLALLKKACIDKGPGKHACEWTRRGRPPVPYQPQLRSQMCRNPEASLPNPICYRSTKLKKL